MATALAGPRLQPAISCRAAATLPASHTMTGTPIIDLVTNRRPVMPAASHLSYSHGASARPLLGETIGANLRRVAAAHADAEAMVDMSSGRRWTYAELD